MRPLHTLLPHLLRKQPQKQLPVEEIVRSVWTHLVGRQIAARSQVFQLYRETLIVHVPDRAWQRQLRRLERQLLARVNRLLGQRLVTGMDFRVDASLAAPASSRSAATSQRTGEGRGAGSGRPTGRFGPRDRRSGVARVVSPCFAEDAAGRMRGQRVTRSVTQRMAH